ncbi:CbtA family protein [Mesorhizobium sp. LHD-90]|uniref:CbtA family protein n=1 Tax=Mesorhizobium sp. LHD-90 TaxID=3071414 RepID=UPI0027E06733|nr:CbtA family protein [Mesorhizobium sp. LHD-90]MDQ6438230.1 CbtA family protein [Mesorhizobium sp. LHD-90]
MNIFRNVVFTAAAAGLLASVVMAGMQAVSTDPLILKAETYESVGGEPAHDHAAHDHGTAATDATAPAVSEAAPAASESAPVVAAHEHGEDEWAPQDGFERFVFNVLANLVSGFGFALILVAVSEFAGGISSWRSGLLWGFAGFAVFTLAPGLGLPPELPAMPAADLGARQVWWISTVAATAAGLALIAFRGTVVLSIVGVALIVAPHIVGAPQPASHESPIPPDLHHQFVVASTVTNLIFWVLLGGLVGALRSRFFGSSGLARNQLA